MSEENIYASPESNPESSDASFNSNHLASRLSRLGASILDSIILIVIILPIMFFSGYLENLSAGEEPSYLVQLAYGLVSIIVFMIINIKLLLSEGQTIGKKALGIKITGLNGEKLSPSMIGKRYGFYFLTGQIPIVGGIVSLVNVLFIFGKEQRCLHDFIAETKVVRLYKSQDSI